jgi:V/A-type H+-transporting ATPase subunit C
MYYLSPSQLGGDTRYAFAVGLVRALEVKLLNQQAVNRLLDAGDIHTLKRELGETEYHHLPSVTPDLRDFEPELHQGLKCTYELMAAIAPEPETINLLRLRYDFLNLKAAYKAKYYGESAETALSDLGVVDKEQLLQIVEQDDFNRLPLGLADIVAQVIDRLGPEPEGAAVDMMFDKVGYGFLYQEALRNKLFFLQGLFKQYIDLTNLKIWLRLKKREADRRLLEESLLDNGLIEKPRWLDLYELGANELSGKLAHTPYAKLIAEGVPRYQQQGTVTHLERLIDNYLLEYVKQARLTSMGPEPLIAYIWAKENEVKILRNILVGKLNGLPAEVIKERLPAAYV